MDKNTYNERHGQKLDDHGVVWGPINSIEDIVEDEQFKSREMILEIDDETFGSLKVPGIVPKLSKTPGKVNWLGLKKLGHITMKCFQNLALVMKIKKNY
ncbi:MAG: hypothetical protein CM15mP85_29990 [Rhodobacterales bacterium]|nr:MAG: hypothetical protein CM15mP85_29990 [Rhodobacterales bacterium]